MTTRPTTISMREEDWVSLVYSIEQESCILMLGPEAVSVVFEGEEMPVLTGLARFVKRKLGPDYDYLDPGKPSAIAQVAVDTEDSAILQAWVREFYEQAEPTSTILQDLAGLPFPLVINTSPVLGIGDAFTHIKPRTVIDYYDVTARARPNPPDPSVSAPLIYKLYGSLDNPDSLILSDEDRLEFLVSVITDTPPVPAKLRSALRDESQAFLFLGFSLHQWQLRLLLHVLASSGRRRRKSFALELEQSKLDVETTLFYQRGRHRIEFPDMGLVDFTRELTQRVTPPDTGGNEPVTTDRPDPHAPVVFMCHASEDAAMAEKLSAALRRNGIRTWLDKENLRGGDRWDSMIRQTLRTDVQYVVVIQSSSLMNKDIGYVNREINLALDRQLEYRAPRRFLIPVTIDGPEVFLPELADIESIDLPGDDGVDELVRTINRDIGLARRQA